MELKFESGMAIAPPQATYNSEPAQIFQSRLIA